MSDDEPYKVGRDVIECDTLEEAIAEAMSGLEPGGEIHVHAADCKYDQETDQGCTCEPRIIVRPAAAEA